MYEIIHILSLYSKKKTHTYTKQKDLDTIYLSLN